MTRQLQGWIRLLAWATAQWHTRMRWRYTVAMLASARLYISMATVQSIIIMHACFCFWGKALLATCTCSKTFLHAASDSPMIVEAPYVLSQLIKVYARRLSCQVQD